MKALNRSLMRIGIALLSGSAISSFLYPEIFVTNAIAILGIFVCGFSLVIKVRSPL